MDHTIDRAQLADVAAQVLQAEASGERLRAAVGAGAADPQLVALFAELGWPAILVPEAHGGFGGQLGDVESLLVEMGRWAAVGPFGSSAVVATLLLAHASADVQQSLLPAMAAGERQASFALLSGAGTMPSTGRGITATATGAGWRLDGRAAFVPYGADADAIVVVADAAGAARGFVVLGEEVAAREHQETWDVTRRFATIELDGLELPADRELSLAGHELVDEVISLAAYWLACDSLGVAQRLVRSTAQYGTERVQFGRPIGSFQAWKHHAADMHIATEASRAAVGRATTQRDRGDGFAVAASVAKLVAGDAAEMVASWATQLHGGIAYTWEHDTQLFLKRAKLNQLLYGDGDTHRDRIARSLAPGEAP